MKSTPLQWANAIARLLARKRPITINELWFICAGQVTVPEERRLLGTDFVTEIAKSLTRYYGLQVNQ